MFRSSAPRDLEWERRRCRDRFGLHHDVASTLANNLKSLLFENAAGVLSRQDAEFTYGPLQSG